MSEINAFEATEHGGKKGTWSISLGSEDFSLTELETNETFLISRVEAEEFVELFGLSAPNPFLLVRLQKRKVVFRIVSDQAAAIHTWKGPPTIRGLKVALKRKLRWWLPAGILIVFSSLPFPVDPESGMEALPFNAIGAFLGASLIIMSVLMRVWPRRPLFLGCTAVFSFLAVDVIVDIARGDSLWWLLLVGMLLNLANGAYADFRRFASVKIP